MRRVKQEKGSIAVYVSVVLLSMLLILFAVFLTSSSKMKSQIETTLAIKQSYEADNAKVSQIYEKLAGDIREPEQKLYEFAYTGAEQTFVVPATAYYKLQVWGAQGGEKNATYAIAGKRRLLRGRSIPKKRN